MSVQTKEKEVFSFTGRIAALAQMHKRDKEGKDSAYILHRLVEISDDFERLPWQYEVKK